MNVDPKGMAASLHAAANSIACNTNAVNEVPDALDAIRLVAVTLENVIDEGAEREGPSYRDMLTFACERGIGFDVDGEHIIAWDDDTLETHETRGASWEEAITKAMAEDKASEQGAETTTEAMT